jgi:hypothetical protein
MKKIVNGQITQFGQMNIDDVMADFGKVFAAPASPAASP